MQELVPELTGADVSLLSTEAPQRSAQSPRQLEGWGAEGLSYRAAGEDYWVSRGGFFQVNRFLVDELVRIVTDGPAGRTGLGSIRRRRTILAGARKSVSAGRRGRSCCKRSVEILQGTGKRAVEATTVEFLRSAVVQRERPELIVMDPPRAGVGAEVCALLARISAPEIVYVSCDPVTLARDLKALVESGYSIAELHMVDMFPQTFHLETVVVLRR